MRRLFILAVLILSTAASAATIDLLPQPDIVLLGVSCGGIHTSTYVTGFTPAGNVSGEVYAWTRCGSSGRGGRTTLYRSWHSIEWDLNGAAVGTFIYDGIVPDPAFTETDDWGDTIYTSTRQTSWGAAYVGVLSKPDANGYVPKLGEKITTEPAALHFQFAPPLDITPSVGIERERIVIGDGPTIETILPCSGAQAGRCWTACEATGSVLAVQCSADTADDGSGRTSLRCICWRPKAAVPNPGLMTWSGDGVSTPIPADLLAAIRHLYSTTRLTADGRYVYVSDLIDEIERLRDSARCEAVGKREA